MRIQVDAGYLPMQPFQLQVRSLLLAFILSFAADAMVRAEPDPSAAEILQRARLSPMSQQADLAARLRSEKDNSKVPLRISLDGGVVRYRFSDPDQVIILTLDEDRSRLEEQAGGRTRTVEAGRLDDSVRGTPFTYEDLALRFLYWPAPKLIGEDTVRTRSAWKLELQSPRETGQYGVARLWIDKESGALLRIEGYNRQGRLIKQFEVTSVQRIGKQWFLQQMRLESLEPGTRKVVARTYLEVEPPAKAR